MKISVAISSDLLNAVDAFVAEHSDIDRSAVVEQALLAWYADRQNEAMEQQFAAPLSPDQEAELREWRAIRRAAAERTFSQPA